MLYHAQVTVGFSNMIPVEDVRLALTESLRNAMDTHSDVVRVGVLSTGKPGTVKVELRLDDSNRSELDDFADELVSVAGSDVQMSHGWVLTLREATLTPLTFLGGN